MATRVMRTDSVTATSSESAAAKSVLSNTRLETLAFLDDGSLAANREVERGLRLRRHAVLLGADDGIRTRDPHLGKVVLYQLSHVRVTTHSTNGVRLAAGGSEAAGPPLGRR